MLRKFFFTGLVFCLTGFFVSFGGGMVHASKASDLLLKPIPILDKLVSAGQLSGINAETGLESLFWVTHTKDHNDEFNVDYHKYCLFLKTKKADGTWDIKGKTDEGVEWSDICAFYKARGVESSTRNFTYKHYIGEGVPSWYIYRVQLDKSGLIIKFTKNFKYFFKEYEGTTILFGAEKEKFLFKKLHGK